MPEQEGTKARKRATIHDVAREAGVSAATVSKVLRGITTVKPSSAARIKAVIKQLDYRTDPLAQGLRGENRKIISAVVPDLESPFFGALVTGLERAAESAGYHMIVASSRENERREVDLIERMNDWRVAGTVLAPVRSENGLGARQLKNLNMLAVLVDRASPDTHFDVVTADNYRASAGVADFLIEGGHRRILLHSATESSEAILNRIKGFKERLSERNISLKVDEIVVDGPSDVQRDKINSFLNSCSKETLPTAVYSLSQHSTLLMLSELRRRGISIPDQISLVGFDDIEWMQTTWPSITTVAQPIGAIADIAMKTLLDRIEGDTPTRPVNILEPCTMIYRQSALKNKGVQRLQA